MEAAYRWDSYSKFVQFARTNLILALEGKGMSKTACSIAQQIKYSPKDLCRVIGEAALANHNYFA